MTRRRGTTIAPFPLECWELGIQQGVKVYEVHGAESWHELCVRYPAEYKEDGLLVPDWGAAAEDWDGVHMSFGGLISSEQARYESPEGWSMHNWWHAEDDVLAEKPGHDGNEAAQPRADTRA